MRLSRVASLMLLLAGAGCTASADETLRPDTALRTASIAPKASIGVQSPEPGPAAAPVKEESAAAKGARLKPATPEPAPERFGGIALETVLAETAEPMALEPDPVKTASVAAFRHQPVRSPRFTDAKPVKFGRVKPAHYAVHGVDVSRWQGAIDWKRLKGQGANFAYIKATDGQDHVDPSFRRNWDGAANAGLARGAYHFFYWCSSAEAQAKWFIRNVPKVKGALPPVIDVEWNHDSRTCRTKPPRERVLAKMKVFMDLVEAHYGQKPVIYTAPDFYADNLKGAFKDYPFWLRAVADHPKNVYPGREFVFWQYSGTGLASGVANHIDLNAFNGSAEGWQKWLAKSVR